MNILLVGAGPMAIEYSKVLAALNQEFTVLGRSTQSALNFKMATGIDAIANGIEALVEKGHLKNFDAAIVAVTENKLGEVTRQLISYGIKHILVEKPGGITVEDIKEVKESARDNNANVFIGYNRRYYASVEKAKQIISKDEGVSSFNFEFTEWAHVIGKIEKEPGIKEEWLLANSSHVLDLAFYLGGKPAVIECFKSGGIDWHPKGSNFAGAGISENGALFSYFANWKSPGRWGIEILTNKHRLYLRPMEKLQIQKLGSVQLDFVAIDDKLDIDFKPGLYVQTKLFISKEFGRLLKIDEQCEMVEIYKKIRGDTK